MHTSRFRGLSGFLAAAFLAAASMGATAQPVDDIRGGPSPVPAKAEKKQVAMAPVTQYGAFALTVQGDPAPAFLQAFATDREAATKPELMAVNDIQEANKAPAKKETKKPKTPKKIAVRGPDDGEDQSGGEQTGIKRKLLRT
jgi:hypothetical protein